MLRDAINEIRLHPGRFVATLLAIAISVGFIAAISTAVNTESEAIARSNVLPYSKADVVVEGYFDGFDAAGAIQDVDGVDAVAHGQTQFAMVTSGAASLFVNFLPVPPETFRWAEIDEGRWPAGEDELAISADGLEKLGAQVGETVNFGDTDGPEVTIVGRTADARSLYSVTVYGSPEMFGPVNESGSLIVALSDDADVDSVISEIESVLPDPEWGDKSVKTGEQARQDAMTGMTADVDIFKYLLYGFAGIALLVGMIIISNTFTILVTQRRRQIGLLRAVGASGGQVRGRLIIEAILLGLIGSVLGVGIGVGVAAVAATYTGSMFWGLVINPVELAVAVGVGVLATLLSVLGPSLAATRVKPLEALQVVPTAAQAKRAGVVRGVFCTLMLLVGAALIWQGFQAPEWALVWAMLAGAAISVAILFAAPLYVAPILRGLGKLFGWTGPTTRLAAENAARNPRRAAATTVALMLAVGLVVTLQVAVSTIRTTGMAAIDQQFPQDLIASGPNELSQGFIDDVTAADGAAKVVPIPSKQVEVGMSETLRVREVNTARADLGLPERLNATDGDLLVNSGEAQYMDKTITLQGANGELVLTVKGSSSVSWGVGAVSAATFAELPGEGITTELWVKLTDRTDATALNSVTKALEAGPSDLVIEGGAVFAGILEEVLGVVLVVLTALLGVAVVIALVGVSNTLGLSVIERQRESALLRALGMQRSGLRGMLLVEALLLALVGTVVGILAGAFFGWLGVSSALAMIGENIDVEARFGIDLGLTAILIAVCVGAAALASILPGRRAANATPTEALAVD